MWTPRNIGTPRHASSDLNFHKLSKHQDYLNFLQQLSPYSLFLAKLNKTIGIFYRTDNPRSIIHRNRKGRFKQSSRLRSLISIHNNLSRNRQQSNKCISLFPISSKIVHFRNHVSISSMINNNIPHLYYIAKITLALRLIQRFFLSISIFIQAISRHGFNFQLIKINNIAHFNNVQLDILDLSNNALYVRRSNHLSSRFRNLLYILNTAMVI